MNKEDALEIYHCPFKECAFNEKKGLKRKFLLDQHLLNCHTAKRFKCSNCEKQYAIEWQLKYHLKTCGRNWICLTCQKVYTERLSLLIHCKRFNHLLPEDAKLKKNIKESQKKLIILPMSLSESSLPKFRPILPKNNHLNFTLSISNTDFNQLSTLKNLNAQNSQIDNYCQTDNLCQCAPTDANQLNSQLSKLNKSTNTYSSVQLPEIISTYSSLTNLKQKAKLNTEKQAETHNIETQTIDSFVHRRELKNQSTSTDLNSVSFLNLKKKSVASETRINNLNKNFCFFNQQFDNDEDNDENNYHLNQSSCLMNYNSNRDPLLSTIAVQTDLDYDDNLAMQSISSQTNQFNNLDSCLLEFNDIQTQTYRNLNDNFTQTDFSFDNIFDN